MQSYLMPSNLHPEAQTSFFPNYSSNHSFDTIIMNERFFILSKDFFFFLSRSANSNCEIAHGAQWFSTRNTVFPQETLDNVWRHFGLSQLEEGRAVLLASSEWRPRKLLNIILSYYDYNDNKFSWSYIYLENVWGTCMQWTWRWGCQNPLQRRQLS